MDGSVWKKTRESLGKVIKKPPLTEKLLSKPPFRFLHDIITEVIKTTGFMKGLYSDTEMKSENVKERDAKMAFLQKAINVVVMVTGENLAVKPARIVAGHEPEKTNELLQAIATCCLRKMSSEDAVRRVLSGDKPESKPQARDTREAQEDQDGATRTEEKSKQTKPEETRERQKNAATASRTREEDRGSKERRERREEKDRRDRRDERERRDKREEGERRERREGGEKRERREEGEKRERREEGEKRERREEGEKRERREEGEKRDRQEEGEKRERREDRREREPGKEKTRSTDREREQKRRDDRDKQREKGREREREKETEKERERRREKDRDRSRSEPKEDDPKTQVNTDETTQSILTDEPPRATTESPARIPRPSSAKGQRRRAAVGSQDESDSEGGESEPVLPPQPTRGSQCPVDEQQVSEKDFDTAGAKKLPEASGEPAPASTDPAPSRRIVRPRSARAAPPRAKRQESNHTEPSAERLSSARSVAKVILDGEGTEQVQNDEDDQFLVQEAVTIAPEVPDLDSTAAATEEDSTHGGLVKKILETKKHYEESPSSPKAQVSDSQLKEKELFHRELEHLRSSVQAVCRSVLPLGKLMDYIQEDVDAMRAELQQWREESRENSAALEEERRLTEEALKPLRSELLELDLQIQEEQTQICVLHGSFLRNEAKIHKMLTGAHRRGGT